MSLTIAIQACCQVFQITYEDLVCRELGYEHYLRFTTERKFAVYFCYGISGKRELMAFLNITERTRLWYYKCIVELLEEEPSNWETIQKLEEKYNQIQAKRIAS